VFAVFEEMKYKFKKEGVEIPDQFLEKHYLLATKMAKEKGLHLLGVVQRNEKNEFRFHLLDIIDSRIYNHATKYRYTEFDFTKRITDDIVAGFHIVAIIEFGESKMEQRSKIEYIHHLYWKAFDQPILDYPEMYEKRLLELIEKYGYPTDCMTHKRHFIDKNTQEAIVYIYKSQEIPADFLQKAYLAAKKLSRKYKINPLGVAMYNPETKKRSFNFLSVLAKSKYHRELKWPPETIFDISKNVCKRIVDGYNIVAIVEFNFFKKHRHGTIHPYYSCLPDDYSFKLNPAIYEKRLRELVKEGASISCLSKH